MCPYKRPSTLPLHWGPEGSDGIFCCFINFIFQCDIQKELNFMLSPHIWLPLLLAVLEPFPLLFRLLIGQHVLTLGGCSAATSFGVRLTSFNSLRTRSHGDEIILKFSRRVQGFYREKCIFKNTPARVEKAEVNQPSPVLLKPSLSICRCMDEEHLTQWPPQSTQWAVPPVQAHQKHLTNPPGGDCITENRKQTSNSKLTYNPARKHSDYF